MYSYGPPHMAEQKQDDQLKYTFSSYVRIQDVALKTYQRRWTIGRSGERGSRISVQAAQHDDDDDDVCVYIYLPRWHKVNFLEDLIQFEFRVFLFLDLWPYQDEPIMTQIFNFLIYNEIILKKHIKMVWFSFMAYQPLLFI